ncbi:malonyl-CoA decarboxylase domain-containing protein [Mangrovicoccus sp. HB161399]|uniref:malonyl-CoA decarboxylase domain-containing protein n=1 Tax=Mangrovicoccus sp. HB161399 TaxID=2720392 RepID=UPI001553572A|nr:malonyl-CoA decarboxylase family protein [Mangrovicoccus sp. HB161399]
MSLLADLTSTLFDRRYLRVRREKRNGRSVEDLCNDLLTSRGEVSGVALASTVLDAYAALDREGRLKFFRFLATELDLDTAALGDAAAAYAASHDPGDYKRLMALAEPKRQELARRMNQVPGATRQLVQMRCDLMDELSAAPELARLDMDFRHLFKSWFNRGFLVLRPINWESPALILEKIIAYEAVHAIGSWDDLRRRLQPSDRRCFAFFHPAMPDEPLIFVEVALTKGVPGSIQKLLSEDRGAHIDASEADTAVFYSISNCQKGLAGISFGNSLIKQVAEDLGRDLPGLKTFVTLSPIPTLMKWIRAEGREAEAATPEGLRRLAALYLSEAKRPNGQPMDPVARFHLGNGAILHEVHAGADTSGNGMAQSGGAMVNYLYDLSKVARNHQAFAEGEKVAASGQIAALVKQAQSQAPKAA